MEAVVLGEIRRIYQRSLKPADSLFNLFFARPVAAPFVMFFARTRVTPNQITFVSFGIMLAAAVLIALAAVGGLLQLGWGLRLETAPPEDTTEPERVMGEDERPSG